MDQNWTGLDAFFYDQTTVDWPAEIEFYRAFTAVTKEKGEAVLEVACGTGRVSARLAREGVRVTGMDLSPEMLAIAREKTSGLANVRWVEGDMCSFDLGERFGLILFPGHVFQFMLTPEDQVSCLACVRRHLAPGGVLVLHLDHQDPGWLGEITRSKAGILQNGKDRIHPQTGHRIRTASAWIYERATQTATVFRVWEELAPDGEVVQRWEWEPKPLHCLFRYEMEHLFARTGFQVKALYGDFYFNRLGEDSPEMIFVAAE